MRLVIDNDNDENEKGRREQIWQWTGFLDWTESCYSENLRFVSRNYICLRVI